MIFNYINFKNYRPYYGEQKIIFYEKSEEFSPYKKNITLVGGLNGAGKTSLINAFFICFYGRRMFSKEEYEIIKKEAINRRHLREGGKSSNIELSFSDESGTYLIKVDFTLDTKGEFVETRSIYVDQNGNYREVASADEEFNEFIDQRIPIDVAPFFIFDAEKIRNLVGDHDKKETIEAIQKIVSLELYKQLSEDLSRVKYNDELNLSKIVKDEEIQKLVKDLEEVATELDLLKSEVKPDEKKIEYLEEEHKSLKHKRRLKLANSSLTKGQLNRQIGELEKEIDLIKNALEIFGKKSLPKIIIAPLVERLQKKIKEEQNFRTNMELNKAAFAPYEKFIQQVLDMEILPPLSDEQKKQLRDKGANVWASINRVKKVDLEKIDILHVDDLSQNDIQSILNWNISTTTDVKSLISRRINQEEKLKKLNIELNDAPDVIDTSEEDNQIAKILEELGKLKELNRSRMEKITRLSDKHFGLSNDLTRKRKAKTDLGPIEEKMELMSRLIVATNEFIERVTVLKAQQLKKEIENILLQLFRKSDLHRVEFSPKEFTLRIFDEFDNEIDLTSRSEGEKQLIALSMIWALTKVSGTNFPFVIDTPLARLDSIHRSNLVNRFFTNLSDQVIILTTDTEITKEFLEEIKPFIQFSYILEYNDEMSATTVREGYFEF